MREQQFIGYVRTKLGTCTNWQRGGKLPKQNQSGI